MPKSKRNKKVSLTQTRKKGLELKQKLIEEIRDCVDRYARIFIFSVQNMRNSKLKDVRAEWKHSRFFFGKNKVTSMALGRSAEDEYRDGLHKVSRRLQGQTGILFTNQKKEEVCKWFDSFSEPDYARAGNVASQTVILEEGPLEAFSHAMEPQLRQLGLPTSLKRGVITLTKEYKVCNEGDTLTPEQARLLKLFGHKMASFHISVESMWSNDGTFEVLDTKHQDAVTPTKVKINPADVGAVKDADAEEEEMLASDEEDEDDDDEDAS